MPRKMDNLIPVKTKNDRIVVPARQLHSYLEVGRKFNTWFAERIKKYDFEPEMDFTPVLGKSTGGRPSLDYALSLDMAKELSMVENNVKGKRARKYFIEKEKELRTQKPMGTLDLLEMSIKQIRTNHEEIQEVKSDLLELKAQTQIRQDYYTVVGYASKLKVQLKMSQAASLGKGRLQNCVVNGIFRLMRFQIPVLEGLSATLVKFLKKYLTE